MRSALSSSEHSRVDLQQLESRICLASTISPISFSPPINSPVGSAAVIALGDFTGDGNVDLLARGGSDGSVNLFKGAGNGTFGTTGTPVPAGANVSAMVVADFDHDGNLDVAAANNPAASLAAASTVTILLGNGDGTFVKASTPFPGANPNALAVGDFNEDGIPDLVSANDSQWTPPGSLSPASYGAGLLLGNGDGTFKSVRKIFLSAPQKHVAVGDFNGDGAADIALAGPNVMSASPILQSIVFAAFNTRTGGGFGVLAAASFPGRAAGLLARDLNNDHRADLEVVQVFSRANSTGYFVPGDTTLRTYLYQGSFTNSGSDTFKAGYAIPVPMTNPAGLSAADFDKDGFVDLAVAGTDARPTATANVPGGIVAVIPGRPSPVAATNAVPIFRSGPAPLSQTVADLNGDGKPDILTGHATGVSALLNMSGPAPAAGNPVSEGGDPIDQSGGDSTASPDAINASI